MIRKSMVKELFKLSLLEQNPLSVSSFRKKKALKYAAVMAKNPQNDPIYRDLFIFGNVMPIFISTLAYLPMLGMIRFDLMPFQLDYMVLFFFVFAFLGAVSLFYNIFYESKDTLHLMPMPLSGEEVFLSRFFVAGSGLLALTIPVFPIIVLFLWRNGYGILWSLLIGFLLFIILSVILLGLNFLLMQILAKSSIMQRMKTTLMTVIMTSAQIGGVVGILILSNFNTRRSREFQEIGIDKALENLVYGPLSKLLSTKEGQLLAVTIGLLISCIVLFLVYRYIMCRFFDYILMVQQGSQQEQGVKKTPSRRKNHYEGATNLNQLLWKYNKSLIADQTVITTSIISPVVFPIIMIFPGMMNVSLNQISEFLQGVPEGLLYGLLIGSMLAFLCNNMSFNLASMMISLDGVNFEHICALPCPMDTYLKSKWTFAATMTTILPLILILGFGIMLQQWLLTVVAMMTYLITHYTLSGCWMIYDLKHLLTSWSNVNELYMRSNKGAMLGIIFGSIILVAAIVGIVVAVARMIGPWSAFIGYLGTWLLIVGFCIRYTLRSIQKYTQA